MPYIDPVLNRIYQREYQRERKRERRRRAIEFLGGKCVWEGCEIDDPSLLEFDHIDRHTKKSRYESTEFYRMSWPKVETVLKSGRFQLLCHRHNVQRYTQWYRAEIERIMSMPEPEWVRED